MRGEAPPTLGLHKLPRATVITGSLDDFFIQGLAGSGGCLPFLPPWVINIPGPRAALL